MKRRAALRFAAASMAGFAGCSTRDGTPTPPPRTTARSPTGTPYPARLQQYAGQFGSLVDASSARLGSTGGQPLDAYLADIAADDTLVYLPRGRYRIDDTWTYPAFENFGVVGDDATIEPPEGYADGIFEMGVPEEATSFLIDGVTFDFRAEETGGTPLNLRVRDNLVVRDVSVLGTLDVDETMIRIDVTGESGTGLVERLKLPDGAIYDSQSYGCFVGSTNRGDITFRDCHVAGFPNNGIYAEPPAGRMAVIGGRFENNDVANVRVGGGERGLVRGVHVRCDTAPEEFGNMRGIRLRQGTGTVIEDSFVELLDVTASDGAITIASEMNAATIRNTHVRIDRDNVAGILAKPPRTNDGGQSIRCENVCIEGSAANTAALLVENRDGCVFDRLSIKQTGADRDGIELLRSADSVLRDSQISVTGEPVVLVGSDLETANVWTNEDPEHSDLDCDSV